MHQYAVFGNPIQHSRSPWIHAHFARQTGQDLLYQAILVEVDEFESSVASFFARGGAGLNITVPFKERAWAMAQIHSGNAGQSGAVNTLYQDNAGQLCGANTDGIGLLRDLTKNHGVSVSGKSVLILGAGGAVKGVMPDLLAENPAQVVIANRTVARAQVIVDDYAGTTQLSAVDYPQIPEQAFDLIINASSAGLHGTMTEISPRLVSADTWCYDMVYGSGETPFQRWAKQQQAREALDGLGMLVEQAAEAFFIWRKCRPDTASVIHELRILLGQQ